VKAASSGRFHFQAAGLRSSPALFPVQARRRGTSGNCQQAACAKHGRLLRDKPSPPGNACFTATLADTASRRGTARVIASLSGAGLRSVSAAVPFVSPCR